MAVHEQRGDRAVVLVAGALREDQVCDAPGAALESERDHDRRQDERDGGVWAPVDPDAGDLAGLQPPERGAPPPRALRLLRYAAALELGRPLTQPGAAVRALGDVWRHLGAALLADDKQVRAARHGHSILRGPDGPPARLSQPALHDLLYARMRRHPQEPLVLGRTREPL